MSYVEADSVCMTYKIAHTCFKCAKCKKLFNIMIQYQQCLAIIFFLNLLQFCYFMIRKGNDITCTMLLEQIKGFYHGITKISLLVGSYTMLSWHF